MTSAAKILTPMPQPGWHGTTVGGRSKADVNRSAGSYVSPMMLVRRRDEDFDAVFDALFAKAVRLAQRIVQDRATAEDVAAEALARTYARWSSVRNLSYLDGWVLRVTTNVAIDVVRKRRTLELSPPEPVSDDGVAVRLALVAAMRALPQRQREAIALRYLAGLSEDEVAASLGISAGTVKTHLHRGVQSLRERLSSTFEEDSVAFI